MVNMITHDVCIVVRSRFSAHFYFFNRLLEVLVIAKELLINEQSLKRTYERRPDLLDGANLTKNDKKYLQSLKESDSI